MLGRVHGSDAVSDPFGFNPIWIVVGLAAAGGLIVIGRWVGAVNADRGTFRSSVEALRDEIREIRDVRDDIRKMLQRYPSNTVSSDSPLKLTDVGIKVSEVLGAAKLAADLAAELRSRAEGKHAYDIQELAFRFVRDEYGPDAEIEAKIKQCAYDNGLNRDEVLDVLAIELRDRLLPDSEP